jgi:2-phosphosulfolactate phosphatase
MPAPDLTPLHLPPVERPLHVHLHARFVTPEALAGSVVIVIDNLRASVTITAALFHGATHVLPTLTVDQALQARDATTGDSTVSGRLSLPLLGGERNGVLIPGFDLDNSPRAYTRERVADRSVIFTTANGTAALLQAHLAARVLVGSFVNLTAIADAAASDPRPVHLLCCGTRDEVGLDDILPAGALVERLITRGRNLASDDSGRLALLAWQAAQARGLPETMADSRGGRGLARLGLEADLDTCLQIDSFPTLPEFDPITGLITTRSAVTQGRA